MLIVMFGVFRGVWVVDGWTIFLQPQVFKINDRWIMVLSEGQRIFKFSGNSWILIDSIGGLFYLGHYDSDGDGREEMYFYGLSRTEADTFYIFEADSLGNFRFDRSKAVYVDVVPIGIARDIPTPPTCYYGDMDKDSYRDILCVPYEDYEEGIDTIIGGLIVMFEAVGDNRWEKKVLMGNAPNYVSPNMMDTDGDGKLEFAYDGGIVEVVGNDSLTVVSSAPDGYSLMVPDADGDGKPEIVFYWRSSSLFKVGIYEADSNDHWSRKVFMVPDTSMAFIFSRSNYGDIDRDGRPELLIGAIGRVLIYKAVGDDEYQLIGRLPKTNADVSVSNVYDLDGDSLMEFAVSYYYSGGYGRTIGYEYEPLGVEESIAEGVGTLWVGDGYVEVEGEGELKVYGLSGRMVKRVYVRGRVKVDVRDLPKGVYFAEFKGKVMKFIRR